MTTESRDVAVDILLAGGHCHSVTLPADSELLRNLLSALLTQRRGASSPDPTFFQVPLRGGESALSFSDQDLAALVTTPPVLIHEGRHVLKLGPDRAAGPVVPARWVQHDDVLSAQEVATLLDFVVARQAQFRPATVLGDLVGYRRASVLHEECTDITDGVVSRVRALLPESLRALGVPPFDVAGIEPQLTAHHDGDFFNAHADNVGGAASSRELTFVYYFHREPMRFSGGELLLYDGRLVNGQFLKADSFSQVETRHNSLVFFPSRCWHEVLPVHSPSAEFVDGRFTVNGWVRRDA